jgi:hypothetical protein
MNYQQEILRYLPAQATAAAFIPIILLVFNKLTMRQTVHKQRDFREKVVALRPSILVPILIGDFVLALLVRLASFYVDRPKIGKHIPVASTA